MILYISTTFIADNKTLIDALKLCQKAGINSIEIGSNHCYECNYDYIKDFPFKYLVHNYFPIPRDSFVLNIASIDTNIRAKSIQHIKKAIEFCDKIGAELYTFHPGFLTDPHGANLSKKNYDFQWDDTQIDNSNYEKANDNLTLSASSSENDLAVEELSVNYKAEEIEIGFNSRYLQDITQQISGSSARLILADAASPTLVQEVGDENVLYVLMPMRV